MRKIQSNIIRYGINVGQFAFSEEKRRHIRAELGLERKFVVGNVARLSYQKNHAFLLKVFREIVDRRPNAVLLLIGRGELEEEVRRQTAELGLDEYVRFLGVRTDVAELLNAMDIFLLPSRYEGLGIVFVEAQANGLPCYTSKDVVPLDANVCGNLTYLSLGTPPAEWAEHILAQPNQRMRDPLDIIRGKGFDADSTAVQLKEIYLKYAGV